MKDIMCVEAIETSAESHYLCLGLLKPEDDASSSLVIFAAYF